MVRLHVLVIEEDEWVADLLATALKDASFEVSLAGSAEGGLQAALRRPPDCIVCDFALADHDGAWFARTLRASASAAQVAPVLLVSSRDEAEASVEGFAAGVDAFMTKPFRLDEVVAQVRALIALVARISAAGAPSSGRAPRGRRLRAGEGTALATEAALTGEGMPSEPPARPAPLGSAPLDRRSPLLEGPPTSVRDLLPPSSRYRGR